MNSKTENQEILKYENTEKSNTLLIVFGGIRQGIGMPVFEFYNFLLRQNYDCDIMFIRDFQQAWYQTGVREHDSVEQLSDYLKDYTESNKYEKIITLGNSMGGFASILFGQMLKANHIIAFSPQTFISREKRFKHFDFRWYKKILNSRNKSDSTYHDLVLFLDNNLETTTDVYYADKHRLDKIHAEQLSGIRNVNLIPKPVSTHGLIRTLRDSGELKLILDQQLA